MIDKNTFDYLWNLHEACGLAEKLGYEENYLDGAGVSEGYIKEMEDKISNLVGKNWPKEVQDSYKRGLAQGSYES